MKRSADSPSEAGAPRPLPGRPRGFDRDEALDAAMLLFWRHGYEGVSLAQLTEAMGIKAPSLYAAFGSKEQLYREALRRYLGTFGQLGVAALDEAPSAREGVAAVLHKAAEAFTRKGYPAGCMVGVGSLRCGVDNHIAEDETAALRTLSQQAITRRLERARKEGELPLDTDCASLAAYFSAVVEGLSVQARDGASRTQLRRIVDLAMRAWPA